MFDFPGMCLALQIILKCNDDKTSLRTNFMSVLSLQDCLFIMSTTAILSERNKIFELCMWFPQISKANIIGKSSLTAM